MSKKAFGLNYILSLLNILLFILVCVPDSLAKMKKSGLDNRLPNFECLKIFYIWFINKDRITLPSLLSHAELMEQIDNQNVKLFGPAELLSQQNYMRFLRLRGQVSIIFENGELVVKPYDGEKHALCDTITVLPLNAPKILINAMSCDFCLMRFSEDATEAVLLEVGISRQISIIQNLKRQAVKRTSNSTYSVNKLMNSILIELRKIDQNLAINITEIPQYKMMQAAQQIARKNTFSKGTIGCLVKTGKMWSGLHHALANFNRKTQFVFDISNSSCEPRHDNLNMTIADREGVSERSFSSDISNFDILNSNVLALGDLVEGEKWPELKNGDPTEEEKSNYISDRNNTRTEILALKNVAEETLKGATNESNKIAPLMVIDETERALIQEEQNHQKQVNKLRLHDIKAVKAAANYAGSITLIDQLARPDIEMYPKKEHFAPHTNLSREVIKKLFSKLTEYEKVKTEMQKDLERRVEEIDGICSTLSNICEPDIVSSQQDLAKIYAKMRSILVENDIELDPQDISCSLGLGEDSDFTWAPENTNESVTVCSFDAMNSSGSSSSSYIFPAKKIKLTEQ